MDGREPPVAQNGVGGLRHIVQERLSLAEGQVVSVADMDVMRCVLVKRNGLIEPPVVLILHGAQRVPIGIFAIRCRNQLTERISRRQVESVGKPVLEAGLEGVVSKGSEWALSNGEKESGMMIRKDGCIVL